MRITTIENPRSRQEKLGQFLTSSPVADFMASMFGALPTTVRLLDAGAGSGSLTTSGIRLYPEFPEWVTDNHWHEFALGAIGPGWVAGGGAACPCLSTNLDGNPERSDVKFLVMMAGGLLAGQNRPSASANNYFDSTNNLAIATGLTFDRQSEASVSFNDQLYY